MNMFRVSDKYGFIIRRPHEASNMRAVYVLFNYNAGPMHITRITRIFSERWFSLSPVSATRLAYLTYLNERIHGSLKPVFLGDAASYENILFRNFTSYFFHEGSLPSRLYCAFIPGSHRALHANGDTFGNIEFIFY